MLLYGGKTCCRFNAIQYIQYMGSFLNTRLSEGAFIYKMESAYCILYQNDFAFQQIKGIPEFLIDFSPELLVFIRVAYHHGVVTANTANLCDVTARHLHTFLTQNAFMCQNKHTLLSSPT